MYVLLGLVTLVLSFYFIRYHLPADLNNKVPADADAVVYIDARQLEHYFLADFILHPFAERGGSKEDIIDQDTLVNGGNIFGDLMAQVEVPKDILLYRSSKLESAWFTTVLGLKDQSEFAQCMDELSFRKRQIGMSPTMIYVYQKGNIGLFNLRGELVLGYFENDSIPDDFVRTIFDNKDFLQEESVLLKPILKGGNDVVFNDSKGRWAGLQLKDGKVLFEGDLGPELDLFLPLNAYSDIKEVEEGDGKVSPIFTLATCINLKGKDLRSILEKVQESGMLPGGALSAMLSSIMEYSSGHVNLKINELSYQSDTIVSYEYDDDFNKKEVKKVQQSIIPDFNLVLGKAVPDTIKLDSQYINRGIVILEDNRMLLKAFPLFKTYVQTNSNSVQLYTGNKADNLVLRKEEKSVLTSVLHFEKITDEPLVLLGMETNNQILPKLKDATLHVNSENKFIFQLTLKDSTRNSFVQLLVKE